MGKDARQRWVEQNFPTSKAKVFVYGTLREGHPLHGHLEGSHCLGEDEIRGLRMFDTGWFPACLRWGNSGKVVGEVYLVDDETLARLDSVEGANLGDPTNPDEAGLYYRVQMPTVVGRDDVWVYVMRRERLSPEWALIPSGDWNSR